MRLKTAILPLLLLFVVLVSFVPELKEKTELLFKIERSKDANTICYAVNVDEEGNLAEEPIQAFWIKQTKKGRIEPLTWIQKKYAYGLKYLNRTNESASFQFVSYDKQNFILKKINNEFRVFTKKDDHILEVQRIFVQLDGGTFWFPKVPEVKLFAHDLTVDDDIVQVIKPQ